MLDSTLPTVRRLGISRRWLPLVCVSASLVSPSLFADEESDQVQILYDAQVFTAESEHPYAEAVAIRGGRILAVGSLPAVEQSAGPGARKIDLKGKFLMPGMIDAHAHPIDGGVTLIQANFPDTADSVPALAQSRRR
jgi:predicted amidohydrolase YtcJ